MSFVNKKGISLVGGFKLQAESPLDIRQQVDTIQDRDELVAIHAAWEGMVVYVKEEHKSYEYQGTKGWIPNLTGSMYTHPSTHAATMITEDATHRFMTDVERNKLKNIAENANNYVHPQSHSLDMITETTTKKIMTDAERAKLEGIAENANNYTHPTNHAATMITEDATHRFATDNEKKAWNAKAEANHQHSAYTPKSKKIEASLNPASWVAAGSGFKYTLSVAGATATNNIEVLVKGSATDAEVEAWMGASIVCGTQADGSITLRGFGEQPSIAIPIEVIVRGDI